MRWILIDEILKIERGKCAMTASRYPAFEFSPEVLLIEMMAQTAGLVVGAESDYQQDLVFTKIESAEFYQSARPGQLIWIEAGSDQVKREGAWMDAQVRTEEKEIARARLLLMNVGFLCPELGKPVTFNEMFMSHYQIRKKLK